MKLYVHPVEKKIYTINDIRALYPLISLPDDCDCSFLGFKTAEETNMPEALPWHKVVLVSIFGDVATWRQDPIPEEKVCIELRKILSNYIESTAKDAGWSSSTSCAVRAAGSGPWKVHGQVFLDWMDSCYAHYYQLESDVINKRRVPPAEEVLISELPKLEWPDSIRII